jgi:hypothetical protein
MRGIVGSDPSGRKGRARPRGGIQKLSGALKDDATCRADSAAMRTFRPQGQPRRDHLNTLRAPPAVAGASCTVAGSGAPGGHRHRPWIDLNPMAWSAVVIHLFFTVAWGRLALAAPAESR